TDGQDRRAAAVHRRGDLGGDPAPGGHEGLEGDRGDQQGSGGADLRRGRLRAGGRPVHRRARDGRRNLKIISTSPFVIWYNGRTINIQRGPQVFDQARID